MMLLTTVVDGSDPQSNIKNKSLLCCFIAVW